MVQGDRKPSIQAALKWKDGSVVDLTNCTVKFHMKKGDTIKVNASASVVPPATEGVVQYDWAAADVSDAIGVYKGEFEVTYSDGKTCTFPTESTLKIVFRKPYDAA